RGERSAGEGARPQSLPDAARQAALGHPTQLSERTLHGRIAYHKSSAAMTTVSRHVYYSGQVQGVGFRYTAQQLAAGFAVSGFVRNLPNGDVELVAEGD